MRLRFSFALFCTAIFGLLLRPLTAVEVSPLLDLRDGDRVVFIGDTLIEREQHYGYVELALASHFPGRKITFRNLGWSADTPAADSRAELSKLQAGHEADDQGWIEFQEQLAEMKPTVVFLGYGMASSFDGEQGLPKFKNELNRLIDDVADGGGIKVFREGRVVRSQNEKVRKWESGKVRGE